MILSGAFFDNNMPKWATEETMKRIGNDLKKDNTQTRKQHDKMILLLGKIVQNSTKEEKTQRETLKEIKNIAKEIKDSNKTNKELVKEVKKSNKLADEANKQAKKTSTTNQKGESIDTSEMESHLLDVNRTLEKIHLMMSQSNSAMIKTMEERNQMVGRSNLSRNAKKSSESEVIRDSSSGIDAMLHDTLEELQSKSGRRNSGRQRITNEISGSKGPIGRFNGRIASMLGAIGVFVKRIKQFGSMILDVIKKIPFIGTKIAAAIAAVSTVSDFIDTIQSSLSDYKSMIDRGISFARANVEGIRMDGIMVRKMIGEAGLTLEAGTEAMKENIAIINELGVKDYMTTIKDVMGNAQNSASFINRIMMSQNDIAEFSRDYLKSLKMLGDYERLNSRERVQGIQRFAKHSRMFAQMTGESIKDLREIITDMASDPSIATYLSGITDQNQRGETQSSLQLITATFGKGSPMQKAFMEAITDVTGAGFASTDAYRELMILSQNMPNQGELLNQLQSLSQNIDSQTAEETANQLGSIADILREGMNGMDADSRENLQILMRNNTNLEAIFGGLLQMQTKFADREARQEILRQGGMVDEKSTETVMLNQQMKTTAEQSQAAVQAMIANAADSDASRYAMEAGYRVMIEANNLTEKGAQAAVTSAHAMVDYLPKISNYIYDILGIMDDDRKTRKEQAEEAMNSRDLGAGASAQRQALLGMLGENGLTTGNLDARISTGRGSMPTVERKYDENMARFEKYGMNAEALMTQAQSSNSHVASLARDMLMYMGSEQMSGVISRSDRSEYRDMLEQLMDKMPDEQRDQYYDQMNQKMRSGVAARLFQAMFKQNFERVEGRNLTSQVEDAQSSEVESASSNAASDAARQAEEAENQRQAQRTQTPTQNESGQDVTFNENGIPNTIARQNATVDNQQNGVNLMGILNDNLNLMNSKLDDLIGITKISSEESQNIFRDIKINTGRNGGSISS